MFVRRNVFAAASNSAASAESRETYASAFLRKVGASPGLSPESAFSISRTWRIAFRGLTHVCGLISPCSPRTGGTPRAVSTIRIPGLARRTGSPRKSSIPNPFATKRSAEAIFFMSPGVRA